jgi:hypothetical protein
MPRPKSKPTDPWAALDALVAKESEPFGKEWFTIKQYSQRYNVGESGARRQILGFVNEGSVERWSGISASNGRRTLKFRVKT